MKNIILVDFVPPNDWEFHKAIEEASNRTWEVRRAVSNQHGNKFRTFRRYWKYFVVPFDIFKHRKEYKSVLAWQQFYGLILAFYCRLFHVKNAPEITIMTFIYKPKRGMIGKLYRWFVNYIVTSDYIKQIIVFSKSEKKYYAELFQISEERFVEEKLGIDDRRYVTKQEEFFVAAGRSNRDYNFLREAWPAGMKLQVLCDTCKDQDTENITYLRTCRGKAFFEKLASCKAVIIPLDDKKVSSGQLVILQSMMLGKPVIVTENETVHDYIENEYNGLIIDKTKDALKHALNKLENSEYYNNISVHARKSYEDRYTVRKMGLNIGKLL